MQTNNVQKLFEERVHDLYAKLDNELQRIQNNFEADDLTTFVAQCGRDYPLEKDSGIIFYGRSPNGWNPECPLTMDGLTEQLHRPIFNLMRVVSEHFYPESWNTHIVWSNVCKVAPATKGNPTNSLWNDQYKFMVDIIKKEMEVLSPKTVVLVTGNTKGTRWDTPLFKCINLSENIVEEIEWSKGCTASLYKKDGRLYIITDRPERRPIQIHADCLIDMIERYK